MHYGDADGRPGGRDASWDGAGPFVYLPHDHAAPLPGTPVPGFGPPLPLGPRPAPASLTFQAPASWANDVPPALVAPFALPAHPGPAHDAFSAPHEELQLPVNGHGGLSVQPPGNFAPGPASPPINPATPFAAPLDPLALVYPERLPVFPYIASAEVIAEARSPDILDLQPTEGRKHDNAPRKRQNEKLRREAFNNSLNSLASTIPNLAAYSHTRKAILLCVREYITQLQAREKKLRALLIAHKLRENGLVNAFLEKGGRIEELGAISGTGDGATAAAHVEEMVSGFGGQERIS